MRLGKYSCTASSEGRLLFNPSLRTTSAPSGGTKILKPRSLVVAEHARGMDGGAQEPLSGSRARGRARPEGCWGCSVSPSTPAGVHAAARHRAVSHAMPRPQAMPHPQAMSCPRPHHRAKSVAVTALPRPPRGTVPSGLRALGRNGDSGVAGGGRAACTLLFNYSLRLCANSQHRLMSAGGGFYFVTLELMEMGSH